MFKWYSHGFIDFNSDSWIFMVLPSVVIVAMEMAIEFFDLPQLNMVIFDSYVQLTEGTYVAGGWEFANVFYSLIADMQCPDLR